MLEAVDRSLDFGALQTDMAVTALEGVLESVTGINRLLNLALEPGADRAALGRELDTLKSGIAGMINSAGFNGVNWLVDDVPTASAYLSWPAHEIVAGLVRKSDGSLSLSTIDAPGKDLLMISTNAATAGRFAAVSYLNPIAQPAGATYPTMYYQLVGTASHLWVNARDIALAATTPVSHIEEMVTALDNVRTKLVTASSALGLVAKRIDMQKQFHARLVLEMTRGIGVLVDADLSADAARLRAIEVRQALCRLSLPLGSSEPGVLLLLA
ncbi:flagellin [Gellertiella hungarica]|uniref:Flagellin n=2 Tax=Gellertiella hungarica TaxID=1572859 RepID=A0A7W6J5D2_9HYPH|nr:flagellin [Gellertiella hungarica]